MPHIPIGLSHKLTELEVSKSSNNPETQRKRFKRKRVKATFEFMINFNCYYWTSPRTHQHLMKSRNFQNWTNNLEISKTRTITRNVRSIKFHLWRVLNSLNLDAKILSRLQKQNMESKLCAFVNLTTNNSTQQILSRNTQYKPPMNQTNKATNNHFNLDKRNKTQQNQINRRSSSDWINSRIKSNARANLEK